ncbi:hypothetical protein P175DRAFT_0469631 [Aspergillus ochraceoroseus IBT 24754]|uniref:Thioesterase domain-containing protein n=1 Tax=Aspergillus ochraceoroseus IBT 24754 TaxID=1392256 RepID=A0A2T5M687_9EURO|nr:uncharacterized protein P175DRAFT_0469631 [Aspergillus ochraceoroseus IBT 24754]PTU24039.1 hypothetical protein P175DRAFT_0469631 [Aspergillus ochraceoroseus IBT 24754]
MFSTKMSRTLSRLLQRQQPTAQPPAATTIPAPSSQTCIRSAQTQATTSFPPEIDDMLSTLPLIKSLRQDPTFKETRPHLAMPSNLRSSHFVGGSLAGQGKLASASYMFMSQSRPSSSSSSSSLTGHPQSQNTAAAATATATATAEPPQCQIIAFFPIGSQMCGHPGFVHGGLLSVLFDEVFAYCASQSFRTGSGMTANLNVNFRKPALPDRVYVLRAATVKVEGRKAWVEGTMTMTSLPLHGAGESDGKAEQQQQQQQPVMVAEASALFVEPKFAESMAPVYRH